MDVKLSEVNIFITQAQYLLLVRLFEAIPRVLAPGPKTEDESQQASKLPAGTYTDSTATPQVEPTVGTSLKVSADSERAAPRWRAVDVTLVASAVCLEFFDEHATNEETLKKCGVIRLSLNDNIAGFKMMSDGATETQLSIKSLTIHNTAAGDSRFREIVSPAQNDQNQVELVYATSVGIIPSSSVTVTVNASHVIFSIDPILALLGILQSPFTTPHRQETESARSVRSPTGALTAQDPPAHLSTLSYQVNIHGISISILDEFNDPKTRAIRLGIKEIALSQRVSRDW